MPKRSLRTRSRKRHLVKLPGGRSETQYKKEKTQASHCIQCGQILSGIPHLIPSKLRKLPANKRRVERMYGGQLCPRCLQSHLKHAARNA